MAELAIHLITNVQAGLATRPLAPDELDDIAAQLPPPMIPGGCARAIARTRTHTHVQTCTRAHGRICMRDTHGAGCRSRDDMEGARCGRPEQQPWFLQAFGCCGSNEVHPAACPHPNAPRPTWPTRLTRAPTHPHSWQMRMHMPRQSRAVLVQACRLAGDMQHLAEGAALAVQHACMYSNLDDATCRVSWPATSASLRAEQHARANMQATARA